ncbi:hypothetical protein [Galbibacter sp. BG1]
MTFKILTYNGSFVDESMLHRGIYTTDEPKLYNTETTIKELEKVYRIVGNAFKPGQYNLSVHNLKSCTLTEYTLIKKEQTLKSSPLTQISNLN